VTNWLTAHRYQPGFRAGILTDDPFEYVSLYFGIQQAGGIVVGLNTKTSGISLLAILKDCSASIVFAQAKYSHQINEVAGRLSSLRHIVRGIGDTAAPTAGHFPKQANLKEVFLSDNLPPPTLTQPLRGSDPAQIIYTSGTTGIPKGVMLRHRNLVANTESIITYLHLTAEDCGMAVLPFFYAYGNSVLLTHIAVGASLVVNQNFLYPNVILDEMRREQVTGFAGVPSTFTLLLHRSAVRNYTFPSLRYLTQAGDAMAPNLVLELKEVFPGVDIFVMYGQTEASPRLSYLPPEDLLRKPGSIGKAIPGVTLRLLDQAGNSVGPGEIGEIVAQGENIMAGYWNRPEESSTVLTREGLRTGDLARMDEEGYLYIIGRKGDMIKSGSHRIAPKEIEEIIHGHKAVREVAVIGVDDEILGETLKACVALKAEYHCTGKEIMRLCRNNLPAFKVPHLVDFYAELPKTATGKICKQKLRQRTSPSQHLTQGYSMNNSTDHQHICTKCILPASFPGISFDDAGFCNHCRRGRSRQATEAMKEKYEQKFTQLLETERKTTSYDLLMAYSGGKDSTFTLDILVNRYGLRVLALTFDNTFISRQAFLNMTKVCDTLGVDHLIHRPIRDMLRHIFKVSAREELYPPKSLERASTICTSCSGLLKAIILRTAIEKDIPFVGFGWSPGQAPIQASVMKTNATLMNETQKAIHGTLHKITGDTIDPYFVTAEQLSTPEKFPWNIHPLAFLDYNEEKIIERNNQLGWRKPEDTDPNSTNCLLNAFANQIHLEKHNFHPYVWEIANMVRDGVMGKDEGMEKIYNQPENQELIDYVRQELGE
jgi:acyl-CoA synthetase (AMP-forming)/AMP-acid ligase II